MRALRHGLAGGAARHGMLAIGKRRSYVSKISDGRAVARHEGELVPALLVTAEEAAGLLAIGISTWWRNVARGLTPAPVRIGGATRWRLEELRDWITAGCPRRARWVEEYRSALEAPTKRPEPKRQA